MTQSWMNALPRFGASADDSQSDEVLAAMKILIRERAEADPDALYEWASVHDFLGREADAIPLYRTALVAGLTGDRRLQAVIQLASSLRNVGDADAAIELLQGLPVDSETSSAAEAFLSLALFDAGRMDEALRVALKALAPTLPQYGRAVSAYADALTQTTNDR